jgi:hypothetical protein
MHDSRQHEEVATGISEFPAELQSFLKVSARYFGLAEVAPELLYRQASPSNRGTGSGSKSIHNHNVTQRGAA